MVSKVENKALNIIKRRFNTLLDSMINFNEEYFYIK